MAEENSSMKKPIAVALIGLTTLGLTACAPWITSRSEQSPEPIVIERLVDADGQRESLTVIGYGQTSGPPDLAYVQLGVAVIDSVVTRAVEESNQRTEAVRQASLAQGIAESDIQTATFNIWAEDRFLPFEPEVGAVEPPRETVYRVENGMRLIVRDVERVGEVIQAALDAGANQVRGVSYSIDDSTALQLEARSLAVVDAQARALQLAAELGLSLGAPIEVIEGSFGPSPIAMFEMGGGGGPPLIGGEIPVSVQVNITYELIP
jgi:uncharacterized protein YggE